jgi:cytochrome c5
MGRTLAKPVRTTIVGCLGLTLAAAGTLLASRWSAPSVMAASPRAPAAQLTGSQTTPPSPVASHGSQQRQLLNRYCVTCHNERLRTAELLLDKADVENPAANAELWEKVIAKLHSGAMPPVGRPRPDKTAMDGFIASLETTIDRAANARPNPGRPAVHRLNRAEYTNAIRDLLALEIDGTAWLPPDDSGYGFDNIADLLSVSPGLLERYLSAAQKISRLALGEAPSRPLVDRYIVPETSRQEERASEDLPFGTRGGIAVTRYFPVDGEYSVNVRMKTAVGQNSLIGANRESPVDVRVDGALVKRFTFGRTPSSDQRGAMRRAATYYGGEDIPENYEFRFPATAGSHVVGVAFPHNTLEPEDLGPKFPTGDYSFLNEADGEPRIDSIEIGGPYSVKGPGVTASRQRIFVCRPASTKDEDSCAKQILSTLAARAYRKPVGETDLRPLLTTYRAARRARTFEGGIQAAIERMLLSPQFLFRIEADPENAGTVYKISDLELASRLSFFLWSTIPDDELRELAARGKLRDPGVLEAQVRRMIADRRSEALVKNFAGQWLFLRDLENAKPDLKEFPDFDDELREAFRRETELFFESQLREDRSIIDMLQARYTFVNERLAELYGIRNVYGTHFRRVELKDPNRGGLLGQASILTVTSYANRTSPVKRGKWVLENILGAPPPAPPPDVPALEETPGVKYKSMRERMDAHRKMAACAACHARIDPLGFAMDNFDGIGKWRTHEGATPVDASGVLDGTRFSGVAELRSLLLTRREEFVITVTKKLLTYGLGRGAEYYDMPAVRQIVRQAVPDDYRWSSLILGIVNSVPFQMRTTQ